MVESQAWWQVVGQPQPLSKVKLYPTPPHPQPKTKGNGAAWSIDTLKVICVLPDESKDHGNRTQVVGTRKWKRGTEGGGRGRGARDNVLQLLYQEELPSTLKGDMAALSRHWELGKSKSIKCLYSMGFHWDQSNQSTQREISGAHLKGPEKLKSIQNI